MAGQRGQRPAGQMTRSAPEDGASLWPAIRAAEMKPTGAATAKSAKEADVPLQNRLFSSSALNS